MLFGTLATRIIAGMTDTVARAGARPGLCSQVELPDGEHGHVTLVVDSFPEILDELVAAGG